MTDEIEYETLKALLIISYSNRIKDLQQSDIADLAKHNRVKNAEWYREKTMEADKNLDSFLTKIAKS